MDDINLNLYKDFYAVSKYGSLSLAAKETYVSTAAISKSIKKLESSLNRQLFYRKPRGMELTSHGIELLHYVEESFNNLMIAKRNMIEEDNLERGKLSIGMPSNIGSFFMFDKIIDFHNKYKNIDITIVTGSTSKLINSLETHQIDFIIDTSPININNDEIIIKELDEVNYVFITKSNYRDIKSLQELNNLPLILPIKGTTNRRDIDVLFDKYNIKINALNLHTSEMIISFVKKDLGIGYVIKNLVENDSDIKILDIKEKLPTSKINIIYNPKYLTTAPIKFIKMYIDNTLNF